MMIELSQRLQCIADQVPKGSRLADIGSDHALLPAYLAENKIIISGIAGELNAGPFEAAKRQVIQCNLGHMISVRQGDGLAAMQPYEADVVTISGMGGNLIVKILEEGRAKLDGVKRLVLQPNVGEDEVRKWLAYNNWLLIQEQIMEEDGLIYEILTAVAGAEANQNVRLYEPRNIHGLTISTEWLYRLGPYLLHDNKQIFHKKWLNEIAKWEKIKKQISKSNSEAASEKEKQFEIQIQEMKEVLQCLQKDKPLSDI